MVGEKYISFWFIAEVKKMYAEKMKERMSDAGYKMGVFNRNGLYLATNKVGKNNSKAKYIRENNAAKMKWNTAVSKAINFCQKAE